MRIFARRVLQVLGLVALIGLSVTPPRGLRPLAFQVERAKTSETKALDWSDFDNADVAPADWAALAQWGQAQLFGDTAASAAALPKIWQERPLVVFATFRREDKPQRLRASGKTVATAWGRVRAQMPGESVGAVTFDFVSAVLPHKSCVALTNTKKNWGLFGLAFSDGTTWLPDEIARSGAEISKTQLQNAVCLRTQSFFVSADGWKPLERGHAVWPQNTSAQDLREKLPEAIHAATQYLRGKLNAKGRFTYIYDPLHDTSPNSYNLIRHAGTLYSLLEAYAFAPDAGLLQQIETSLDDLQKWVKPCGAHAPSAVCVVEKGKVKLGANALTLLALTKHASVTGDRSQLERMRGLARGIAAFQTVSGEFWSSVTVPDWQKTDHVSDYYPGEAILALTRLYQIDPDPLWLATAQRGADFIVLTRDIHKTPKNILHDHWMLIALNDLQRLAPADSYLTHVEKIVAAIRKAQIQNSKWPDENGGYYNPPRSTPTAVRSEGLIAAYHLLKDSGRHATADSLLPTLKDNLLFQLRTQVGPETALSFPNANAALGGFLGSFSEFEIRIDYVQHNLSSLIGAYALNWPESL